MEEALCFGWIDGIKRRRDDDTYSHRFTPRKPNSRWSPTNLTLAKKLIAAGKITKAGLKAYQERVEYRPEVLKSLQTKTVNLPSEFATKIKKHKKAWENFNKLPPSQRKQYTLWLTTAKKPETREKRLKEAIHLLAKNEKLGMK